MRCTQVPSAETQPGKWSNINPCESPLQLEIAQQAQKNKPRSSNSILSIVTEKKSALTVCETRRAAQNSK